MHRSAGLDSLMKQTYNAIIKGSSSDGSTAQHRPYNVALKPGKTVRELHPCSNQKITTRQIRLRPKAG